MKYKLHTNASKKYRLFAGCFELNSFFYDPSHMLQLSEFVWTLRSSVRFVFNNFLLVDETDRNKISSTEVSSFLGNPVLYIILLLFTFLAYGIMKV